MIECEKSAALSVADIAINVAVKSANATYESARTFASFTRSCAVVAANDAHDAAIGRLMAAANKAYNTVVDTANATYVSDLTAARITRNDAFIAAHTAYATEKAAGAK